MDPFREYVDKPGAKAKLARGLNLTHSAIWQWRGRVPVHRLLDVERLTGIPREALRPDLYYREPA